MKNLHKLRELYNLKSVYRSNTVHKRHESSAEHSRSAMLLADYFMSTMNLQIDRIKVYELLMYHDMVELETGDISLKEVDLRKDKAEKDLLAMRKIASNMPKVMGKKYEKLFNEFEENKTLEARFANAIDKLDADIHCMNSPKEDFEGWTEELARLRKQKYYKDFPEINEAFEKLIKFYKDKGYI